MKRALFVIGLSRRLISLWLNLSLVIGVVQAQSIRSLVNGGNGLYEEKKFADAEVNYRKALEKDITTVPGHFNLGNSLYRQEKYDESVKSFQDVIQKAETNSARAQAQYNLGNAHLKANKFEDAVKSFTESLKLNPNDQDAKYNLSYALQKMKEQQQQQKNQKNDKNQDKNKNKQDKDKQDQNKQEHDKQDQQKQDQEKQQQQQDQQQQNQQEQQKQQLQQEKQMSKADAERILEVLKNNEKNVQKKLRQRVAGRPKSEKDW
jgi:Ca-activated chloride channel family protein